MHYVITTRDNQTIRVPASEHLNAEVAQWGLRAVLLHAEQPISAGNVATIEVSGEAYDMTDGHGNVIQFPAQDPRKIFAATIANRTALANQMTGRA